MLNKRAAIVVLVFFFILITGNRLPTTPVYAQSTCDLCGQCVNGATPTDYADCGACLYDSFGTPGQSAKSGVSWTVIGCIPTDPAGFTQKILEFTVSIAGGIAFITLLFGSFKVLTSSGDPIRLTSGKNLIVSSIIALLIVLFTTFILKFVGVSILKIPGFGG